MNAPRKIVSISTTRRRVVASVEIDAKLYDVHAIVANDHAELKVAEDAGDVPGMVAIARRLVPEAPEEAFGRMEQEQLQQILILAGTGIEAVEKMFPNAVRPETSTSPA